MSQRWTVLGIRLEHSAFSTVVPDPAAQTARLRVVPNRASVLRARSLALTVVVALAGGCTVDPAAHPGTRCSDDLDCAPGARCYRGFCLSDRDGSVCGVEVACNGVDDDCDGTVDEHPQPTCETGLPGACRDGTWACMEGAPTCVRSTFPAPETCNGSDDDCDGAVDEGADARCYPDGLVGCEERDGAWSCTGACGTGVAACRGGALGPCLGAQTPSEERCGDETASDDDCDGDIDEGCACVAEQACYGGPAVTAGVGACRAGVQACDDGALDRVCRGQVLPMAETCANPGVDDDCNGVVDDVPRLGEPCFDAGAVGDCRVGRLACTPDALAPLCAPGAPSPETCDGNDEDCDGRVDEGFDLSRDPLHCGACGVVCGGEETCCGGRCVDTRSSGAHCGACAGDGGAACGAGEVCCGGRCEDAASCGSCMADCAAMGRSCCTGSCVDVETDERNCGGCGITCGGAQVCCGGRCVESGPSRCGQSCSTCEAGGELCCAGSCVPIGNDHCNACGVTCGTGDCCGSGCVDLQRDALNCGTCGNACPLEQACSEGRCCPTGQSWCAMVGACRDLATDDDHCGGCGNGCGATSRCCAGTCRLLSIGC